MTTTPNALDISYIRIISSVLGIITPPQERSFTFPHWPQLHHCLSTTLPQREHSQNAGPLGGGGGLLLAPVLLFLNETILECAKSVLVTGRFCRLLLLDVGSGRLAARSFASCSASCWVTWLGLTVSQASHVRNVAGLWRVQISHVQPLADDGAGGSGMGSVCGFGPESDLGTVAGGLAFADPSDSGTAAAAKGVAGPDNDFGTAGDAFDPGGPPGRDRSGITGGRGLDSGNAPPPLPAGNAALGGT